MENEIVRHVNRSSGLANRIQQGTVDGGRVWQRASWMAWIDNIKNWRGKTTGGGGGDRDRETQFTPKNREILHLQHLMQRLFLANLVNYGTLFRFRLLVSIRFTKI